MLACACAGAGVPTRSSRQKSSTDSASSNSSSSPGIWALDPAAGSMPCASCSRACPCPCPCSCCRGLLGGWVLACMQSRRFRRTGPSTSDRTTYTWQYTVLICVLSYQVLMCVLSYTYIIPYMVLYVYCHIRYSFINMYCHITISGTNMFITLLSYQVLP